MDNKKTQKTHFCDACFFSTKNKADYIRHCSTNKHLSNLNEMDNKWITKKTQKNALPWRCECGKIYKFQSGLCKHKRVCIISSQNIQNNEN